MASLPLDLVGHVVGSVERLVGDVRRDWNAVVSDSQRLWGATRRTVRDTRKASPRFARILAEGAWLASLYRIHRARVVHLDEAAAARRAEQMHRLAGARVRDLCLEMGGGVLKLGQFLSCRRDLLPAAWIEELSELQDRVPAEDADEIAARVEEELGAPIAERFKSFEREPMAAASLAQVHAAELPDGTRVAVKVQRPGIEEVIEVDMAALRMVLGIAGDLLPRFDHATVLEQLTAGLRRELDFVAEADSSEEVRANLAGTTDVIVPRVYRSHSSSRVLTLELIDGERLTDFLDGHSTTEPAEGAGAGWGVQQRDHVLATMLRATAAQVLGDGVFHADPHPGNFLVVRSPAGPKLAILDFGCVERLDADARRGYAAVVMAVASGDDARLATALQQLGFVTRDGDTESLRELAKLIMEGVRPGSGGFAGIDPRQQMEQMMEMVRENPVVAVPGHFVMLGRVLGALGGLLMHYKPKIDLLVVLAPYLMAAAAGQAQGQGQKVAG